MHVYKSDVEQLRLNQAWQEFMSSAEARRMALLDELVDEDDCHRARHLQGQIASLNYVLEFLDMLEKEIKEDSENA